MKTEMDLRELASNGRPALIDEPSLHALHQAATRLADARRGAPRFRTKELVGLLLSHGARTWRNSMPRTNVRLRVTSPEGRQAVRVRVAP